MAVVLGVASQQGGVGRTTTAVNLAAALASAGRSVLLVDLCPQADATRALGHREDDMVMRGLVDDQTPPPKPLDTVVSGLHLLAGGAALATLVPLLWTRDDRLDRLRRLLAEVGKECDRIVIDAPGGAELLSAIALATADALVIPVRPSPFAEANLVGTLEQVRQAKKRANPGLAVLGVLITQHDARDPRAVALETSLRATYGDELFETVVPEDAAITEAAALGRPVLSYRSSSRGAWAYVELAKEVESHARIRRP